MADVSDAPYLARLAEAAALHHDEPRSHQEADEVLCDLLRALGYGEVVVAWREVPKWYE